MMEVVYFFFVSIILLAGAFFILFLQRKTFYTDKVQKKSLWQNNQKTYLFAMIAFLLLMLFVVAQMIPMWDYYCVNDVSYYDYDYSVVDVLSDYIYPSQLVFPLLFLIFWSIMWATQRKKANKVVWILFIILFGFVYLCGLIAAPLYYLAVPHTIYGYIILLLTFLTYTTALVLVIRLYRLIFKFSKVQAASVNSPITK